MGGKRILQRAYAKHRSKRYAGKIKKAGEERKRERIRALALLFVALGVLYGKELPLFRVPQSGVRMLAKLATETSDKGSGEEVLLVRYLRPALERLNPGLPAGVYGDAIRILSDTSVSESLDAINREKYKLLLDGIPVRYTTADGTKKKVFLRVFDFANPAANHFLCVRELWLRGSLGRRRRADVVGFVNGVPLVFVELKNVTKDIFIAYRDNFCDYRKVVPQIFHFNAFVILANGIDAKIGTHSAKFKFVHAWKRLSEDEPGAVDMETLLKGTCSKANLLDLFENFIVYDESAGSVAKILARNHQYLGVNRAVESVHNRRGTDGKLGVFWHTQGSGKSYSMVYFTRKVHRKLGSNYTFLVLTDRDELDTQIYKTFAGCGIVDNDKDECHAASGAHLKALLGQHKRHVFSLIQKFNEEVRPGEAYTTRDDIIVISDEAHRSQSDSLRSTCATPCRTPGTSASRARRSSRATS